MENGLYKVEFRTPIGFGSGVVFLHDGKLHGGDSGMFYTGSMSEEGNNLTAQVEGNIHTQMVGLQSVFGVNHTHISLKGTGNGKTASFTGTAKETPNVSFQAKLTKISD